MMASTRSKLAVVLAIAGTVVPRLVSGNAGLLEADEKEAARARVMEELARLEEMQATAKKHLDNLGGHKTQTASSGETATEAAGAAGGESDLAKKGEGGFGVGLKADRDLAQMRVKHELAKLEAAQKAAQREQDKHEDAKARVKQELAKLEALHSGAAAHRKPALAADAAPPSSRESSMRGKIFGQREEVQKKANAAEKALDAIDAAPEAVQLNQKKASLLSKKRKKHEEL